MFKTGARASLAHQLVALLLVFSLLAQLAGAPVGVAAERRAGAGGSKETGDASPRRAGPEAAAVVGPHRPTRARLGQPSPQVTRLTYLGQVSAYCGSPLAVAAHLTDLCGNALADRQLNFAVGAQTVSATTDAEGIARASTFRPLRPPSSPLSSSTSPATKTYSSPSQDSAQVRIDRIYTSISYTGKTVLAVGATEKVSATLMDATGRGPVRRGSTV